MANGQRGGRFRPRVTLAPRYTHKQIPGLPEGAMVVTNTERKDLHCPRRWWYSRGLGLQSPASGAMRFGSSFDTVMEGILDWYRLHPDEGPITMEVVQDGPLQGVVDSILQAEDLYPDGVDREITRLTRAVEGWVHTYAQAMGEDYRVLDAQPMIAVPITSPTTGKVYRSKVPVVTTPDGWRLATAMDSQEEVSLVTLPWFQLTKLDGVVLHRGEGTVWAWETKTSGNPEGYSRDLHLDTQLPGYTRALWYATQVLGLYGGRRVGGYVWDVTSSQEHRDPRVLSSGRLSTASGQRVPSWRWRMALDAALGDSWTVQTVRAEVSRLQSVLVDLEAEAAKWTEAAKVMGRGSAGAPARTSRDAAREAVKIARETLAPLQDALELDAMVQTAMETVDPSLYVRRWGEFSTHALVQYEVELFQDAVRIGQHLRRAVETSSAIPSGSPESTVPTDLDLQVALHFPRVPICRTPGGFCPYTGPCLQDGEVVRSNYESRSTVRWLNTNSAQEWSWDGEEA